MKPFGIIIMVIIIGLFYLLINWISHTSFINVFTAFFIAASILFFGLLGFAILTKRRANG